MADSWIGRIPQDDVIAALTETARLMAVRATDVATYTPEQWDELAGRAFGVCLGAVRLGVLLALAEADEEIRASRRIGVASA